MIHFAHANGFPSECYQALFKSLRLKSSLCFIPIIGHNDDFPITENWSFLVDEVIESIQRQTNEAVIGVGHSLGGVLTLLASCKAPKLFKQVILLDAPIFGLSKSTLIKLIKSFNLMHLVTPYKITQRRQEEWDSLSLLKAYLLTKSLFKNFNEACLNDYIRYGFSSDNDGRFRLKFNRERESLIYKTVPHNMHRLMKKHCVPTSLIYSQSSHIITKHDLFKMKNSYEFNISTCHGTHLFPFEHPQETSDKIVEQILLP